MRPDYWQAIHPVRNPGRSPGWMAAVPAPAVSLEVTGGDFVTVADSLRHEG